jgi:hypothetical protein
LFFHFDCGKADEEGDSIMVINCIKKQVPIKAVMWDGTNLEEVMALTGMPGVVQDNYLIFNLEDKAKDHIARIGDYIVREGFDEPLIDRPERFAKFYAIANTYSWALDMLKAGHRVCRKGWNGKGMWLKLHTPNYDVVEYALLPWIGMKTADDCFVPWLCSQTDALAEDWELVE